MNTIIGSTTRINTHKKIGSSYQDQIRNYSLYFKDDFLFAYFEYTRDCFNTDMKKMAADETTQEWWSVCDPCQEPLETCQEGEWWSDMEEVYHLD
ncbi:MAG: L-rhamnose mutarotase [Cellulosilyticaceae bacterium]